MFFSITFHAFSTCINTLKFLKDLLRKHHRKIFEDPPQILVIEDPDKKDNNP